MKRYLLGGILLLALLAGCSSRLPAGRPADFSATYDFDGGMLPYGQNLQIAVDQSRYQLFDEGVTVALLFQTPVADLDALYQIFRANETDRIRTYTEDDVYDRGGVSLALTANGQRYDINNSGRSFVRDNWAGAFSASASAFRALVTPPDDADGHELILQWDDSLSFNGVTIEVDLGTAFIGIRERQPGAHSLGLMSQGADSLPVRVTGASSGAELNRTVDLTQFTAVHIKFDGTQFVFEPLPSP